MGYVLKRIAQAVFVWLLASLVVFLLVRLVPGDPAVQLLPSDASQADVEAFRENLGLNEPIYAQYASFLTQLASGDFGTSYVYRRPVTELITNALPITLQVVGAGFLLAVLVAVPLGILAARRPGSAIDNAIGLFVVTAQSVPTYWLAFILIALFALNLRLFPTSGYGTPAHLVLPAISIAAWVSGVIAGVTRESLLEVYRQPYITTARAKGLGAAHILVAHAMRNSMVQISTVIALEFGYLLSGAIITEVVFGLPGIGSLGYAAILQRDYPIVQGIVLWGAAGLLLLNALLDMLYRVLDPRIR